MKSVQGFLAASLLLTLSCQQRDQYQALETLYPEFEKLEWRNYSYPVAYGGGDYLSVADLWWYGRAKAFGQKTDISVECDNCTEFILSMTPKGKIPGYAGVEILWEPVMEAGNAYAFKQIYRQLSDLPDFIVMGNRIIWENGLKKYEKENPAVRYYYIPEKDKEPIKITLVYEVKEERKVNLYHSSKLTSKGGRETFLSYRSPWKGERPGWKEFKLPRKIQTLEQDPTRTADLYSHLIQPVDYRLPPLPVLDRDADSVTIFMRNMYPTGKGVGEALQHAGVETMLFEGQFYVFNDPEMCVFGNFAEEARKIGIENLAMPGVLDEHLQGDTSRPEGFLRHLFFRESFDPVEESMSELEFGRIVAGNVSRYLSHWLDSSPGGQAYFFNNEMNGTYNYGVAGNGRLNLAYPSEIPEYAALKDAGPREAYGLIFRFFGDFHNWIREGFTEDQAEHFRVVGHFDRAAFQNAYAVHCGVDMVVPKNIHRQSLNIVVANARGTARAYDVEYGYCFDMWNRTIWPNMSPETIENLLKVYYHAGAGSMMNELPVYNLKENAWTGYAPVWLDFVRYAKTHPQRGISRSRIAVMRAMGDDWNRVASPSSGWESVRLIPWLFCYDHLFGALKKEGTTLSLLQKLDQYIASKTSNAGSGNAAMQYFNENRSEIPDDLFWYTDFNLLNLFFRDYGNYYTTDMDRLVTGTPYGPVDFIPWDTPLEKMNQYDVIIYLGRGLGIGSTRQERENLEDYVHAGGRLVMARGQLRNDDDGFERDSFCGIGFAGMQPGLTRGSWGKGEIWLASGEWLTCDGYEAAECAVMEAAEPAKWLILENDNGYIEYNILKKREMYSVPVFNHGRGKYPANNGIDHGAWDGKLILDRNKFRADGDMEVWKVKYNASAGKADPFTLEKIRFHSNDATIEVPLQLDEFEEIIIAPAGKGERLFYDQ